MRIGAHEYAERVDLQLRPHGGGVLHLFDGHVDDLELRVGDDDTVTAGIARGLDDRQRLGRRSVARAEHELLLRADLRDLANGGHRLAVGADDLDPFRGILEVFDVVVGVEGWQPDHASIPTLHAPHPLDGLGVDAARRPVEADAAECLDPWDVLAHEPRAIGGQRDVVFQHDGLRLPHQVALRGLVVVHGAPERIRSAVRVEVDESLDRTHRGRRRREDAHLGLGRAGRASAGGNGGHTGGGELEEPTTTGIDRSLVVSVRVAAAIHEAPARETERLHRSLLAAETTASPDQRAKLLAFLAFVPDRVNAPGGGAAGSGAATQCKYLLSRPDSLTAPGRLAKLSPL